MEVRWDTHSRSTCSACACAYARGAWPVHGATMACINGVHAVHVHASVQHTSCMCTVHAARASTDCAASVRPAAARSARGGTGPAARRQTHVRRPWSPDTRRRALGAADAAFPSAGFMAYPYGATSRPPVCGAAISPPRLQPPPARRRLAPCACAAAS